MLDIEIFLLNIENDIKAVKTRVAELEGSFNDLKTYAGHETNRSV